MKLDISEVTKNGNNIGKTFYVCDYRKPDFNKKAIRNVKPTKVIILDQKHFEEAGKKYPRIYYSKFALIPVDSKGKLKYSNHIPPYDTTGYRSYAGTPVNVFDNYEECVEFYNQQVDSVVNQYKNYISTVVDNLTKEMETIQELKIF